MRSLLRFRSSSTVDRSPSLQRPSVPIPPTRTELFMWRRQAQRVQRFARVTGVGVLGAAVLVSMTTSDLMLAVGLTLGTLVVAGLLAWVERRPVFARHRELNRIGVSMAVTLCDALPNGDRYRRAVEMALRTFVEEDLIRLARYQRDLARWTEADRAFVTMSVEQHAQRIALHPGDAHWWHAYRPVVPAALPNVNRPEPGNDATR